MTQFASVLVNLMDSGACSSYRYLESNGAFLIIWTCVLRVAVLRIGYESQTRVILLRRVPRHAMGKPRPCAIAPLHITLSPNYSNAVLSAIRPLRP